MQLSEIFDALAYGEFSQINLGAGEGGGIPDNKIRQVISHINLGMTMLHKRFNLKDDELTLLLKPGMETYILKDTWAVSAVGSREPVRTILDTRAKPYQNNIVKIQKVSTAAGFELGLNNAADKYSVFTPQFNILRVPVELTLPPTAELPIDLITATLKVEYESNAIPIPLDLVKADLEDTEVELPQTYLMALLYFIAGRVLTPTGAAHNEANLGGIYNAKFEKECASLKEDGLDVDQGSQSTRLRSKGWV